MLTGRPETLFPSWGMASFFVPENTVVDHFEKEGIYVDPIIRVERVSFHYGESEERIPVLYDVDFELAQGEAVAIVGHNGSGKSTFAKLLNGLLHPSSGEVWVSGTNTKNAQARERLCSAVGIVFQQPDNQLVETIVEDDIAFGPENIGVPQDEIRRRVDEALEVVGMSAFRDRPPHRLSGGQKQRIAIAGVLAMQPSCIVFDESTSMLDTYGRREVMEVIQQLRNQGVAIVSVTHHMEEVVHFDRVIVFQEGRIVSECTPRQLFTNHEQLAAYHLEPPEMNRIAAGVHRHEELFRSDRLTVAEVVDEFEHVVRWQQRKEVLSS